MITKLAKKLKTEKQTYNFKTSGFAGLCPDCGSIVEFKMYFQEFNCTGKDCAFVANVKGKRVWDNEKREEHLKRIQQQSYYRVENNLD